MVSEAMLATARRVQESMMPQRCSVLVAGSETISHSGNKTTPYTPDEFTEGSAIACRVQAGVGREWAAIGNAIADLQKWTVTLPASTSVKLRDRIAIEDFDPEILDVEYVSNGGSFETAVVVICTKAS